MRGRKRAPSTAHSRRRRSRSRRSWRVLPALATCGFWRDYTFTLRNTYILLTTSVGRARNYWLDKLNFYLDKPPKQLDGLSSPSTNPNFDTGLRELVLAFENKEEAVVRDVADSPTVLTGKPTRDRNVPKEHYVKTQRRPCDAYF